MARPGFSHCFLHVTDLERTRDVLRRSARPRGAHGGPLATCASAAATASTSASSSASQAEVGAPGIELELKVADVDALVAELREAGISVTEPSDQEWGARHAWLHDPDGYRLSIWSPIE